MTTIAPESDASARTIVDCGAVAVTMAVQRDGRIIAADGCSDPAVAAASSMTSDRIVWIGCVGKTLTTFAVMLLADRGGLGLDDPIDRFLPGQPSWITVRHLLTHTADLPQYPSDWTSFFDDRWLSESLASVVTRVPVPERSCSPGRSYSSAGFALLGRIVEVVSAAEFGAFVSAEICGPLGMHDTFPINDIPASKIDRIAPVLTRTPAGVSVAFDARTSRAIRNSMPFAGFFSTPTDMLRLATVMLEGGACRERRILSDAAVDDMLREHVPGSELRQGLGWFLCYRMDERFNVERAPDAFWHSSSSGSMMLGDRLTQTAIVMLGQSLFVDNEITIRVRIEEWKCGTAVTNLLPIARVPSYLRGRRP